MKKLIVSVVVLCLLVSLTPSILASEPHHTSKVEQNELVSSKKYSEEQYDKEEIFTLQKYITVKNGLFVLDYEKAEADGIKQDLLNGQKSYFEVLNSEIAAGKLKANPDLSIIEKTETNPFSDTAPLACKGKTTKVKHYWWGYNRKLNSCATDKMSADLSSVSAIATGISVVTAYFGVFPAAIPGLSAAYFALMGARADANNKGKGINADVTWALAYDFEPQK